MISEPATDDRTPETPPMDADAYECMALLRMAGQLRQEQDHIDGMFAALRGEEDIL